MRREELNSDGGASRDLRCVCRSPPSEGVASRIHRRGSSLVCLPRSLLVGLLLV